MTIECGRCGGLPNRPDAPSAMRCYCPVPAPFKYYVPPERVRADGDSELVLRTFARMMRAALSEQETPR